MTTKPCFDDKTRDDLIREAKRTRVLRELDMYD